MSRVLTPAPTDKTMWRRLLRLAHPDTGGDGELFVWVKELHNHVGGDGPERAERSETARVPFEPDADHGDLTRRALQVAEQVADPYRSLLRLLEDCTAATSVPLRREERRGASYKRLAALGHSVGMSKSERCEWYRVAESIPLSDRHASHLLREVGSQRRRSA